MKIRKTLITLLTLCLGVSAFAAQKEALVPISGTVQSVESYMPCPVDGSECEVVSVLKVSFALGCTDELGPVTYSTESGPQGKIVYISALKIDRDDSNIKCFRQNVQTAKIMLGMGIETKDTVQVKFLQNQATK